MKRLSFPVWAVCWLICLASAILLRPPLPVDETRYLAVAWEMWLRGDFLVPYLNGEAYHHKPPLLFWLMHAGWSVFGVNEWWPRLVAPLFALAALWGTGRLSRLLWPDDDTAASLAPVILVGALFWSIFQTLTMFDMMLATCAVAGICGVLQAWRQGGIAGWVITALAIGVGVLAKGPAILLHIVPVALFAPWWGRVLPGGADKPLVSWRRWYLSLLASVLVGVAIALLWAIPAGIRGGAEYREMIFWGQSAGRIVESFDHARPFWWYAVLLPPLLLPWLVWPRLWRALRARRAGPDGGIRLLIAWAVPALVIFSLISGKQLHYLLPEFPAFALLFARRLGRQDEDAGRRFDGGVVALFFGLLGLVMVFLVSLTDNVDLPEWFAELNTLWGLLLLPTAFACWKWVQGGVRRAAHVLALAMALLVAVVHLAAQDAMTLAFDLRPLAKALKVHEDQGTPLANFGKYHGQYQFLGRLHHPMAELALDQKTTDAFVAAHPDGIIVAYYYLDELPGFPDDVQPIATYQFRNSLVVLWRAGLLERYPHLADRS